MAGALMDVLHDQRPYVASAAAQALVCLGERSALPLVHRLEDLDLSVRRTAADILRLMGPAMGPAAVDRLCRLAQSGSVYRASIAIHLLGFAGGERAVEVLLQMWGHNLLGMSAQMALGTAGEAELVHAVRDALHGNLRRLERTRDARAVPVLLSALDSGEPPQRTKAALALGMLGDARATDALIEAMDQEYPEAQRAAVYALAQVGEGAGYSLRRTLADRRPRVRVGAGEALGRMGDAAALPPIGHNRGTAPLQIAVGRAYLGDALVLGTLRGALNTSDAVVQCAVAAALGALGTGAVPALPALRGMARAAEDETLRRTCRAAVDQIEAAVRSAPAELEAAYAPAGTGTELEEAPVPEGRGDELKAP